MIDIIQKDLVEKTNNSISDILDYPVEKIAFNDRVPVDEEITDSNKVYKCEVSILFVDMRNSTEFTDDNSAKTVVKVYRSFLKTITRAIRKCHGNTRDYIGDGVLAVFSDKQISGEMVSSAEQAVCAGKTICTLIDYCLNPKLKEKFDIILDYGIGICTGTVLATKVGMRGNEKKPDVENETGVIWLGSCTNHASKLCDCASAGETIIDKNTYLKLSKKQFWAQTRKIKDDKTYDCFVSSDKYLRIETDTAPVCIQTEKNNNSIVKIINDALSERLDKYDAKIRELALISEKAEKKEKQLDEKENALRRKENGLKAIDKELKDRRILLDERNYDYYVNIIGHAFCNRAYTVECGEAFWDEQLKRAKDAGAVIGKSELEVEIELCYALVDIYENLKSWEKAYDFLCVQAEHYSWIHASDVRKCVEESSHWIVLKQRIENRIADTVPYPLGKSLRECLSEIQKLGY